MKKTHKTRICLASATTLAVSALSVLCGCSAADDYMDNYVEERKAAREEKAAKAKQKADEEAQARAAAEKDATRQAQAREDTVKDEIPLHVSNPSAWFHETNDTMLEIRKRLEAAISSMDKLVAKYEGKLSEAGGRQDGYPKLLEQLEAAKAADKWPVAVGKIFLDSAEKCDAKIAEVKAVSSKNAVSSVKDEALLNGVKDGAKAARERLKAFNEDYEEFLRRWDMFRAGTIRGVPKQLNEQVVDAMAVTARFLEEWESVE